MDTNSVSNVSLLLLVAGTGAFGGFVDGLIIGRTYRLRIGSRSIDLGFVGDMLLGATSSVAIFSVAGALLNIKFSSLADPAEFLRVVAWGVLSGFAGLRLLQPLSERMVRQIARDTVVDAVSGLNSESMEASMEVKRGEADLANFDLLVTQFNWLEDKDDKKKAQLNALLTDAGIRFDLALKSSPGLEDALQGKARTAKRRAQMSIDEQAKNALLKEAIEIESKLISSNPKASRAYYNRACYQVLLGAPESSALSDLQTAFDGNALLKTVAREDKDLKMLQKNPQFQHLLAAA